jgi:hypothetical protein
MFSLLLLSTMLAASSAATQPATAPGDLLAVEPPPLVMVRHGLPEQMIEEQQRQQPTRFDAMEIYPEGDICFKIRAYVFSTGPVPKLLRETTCGPKRGEVKSIGGAKPKLVPIDAREKPAVAPER